MKSRDAFSVQICRGKRQVSKWFNAACATNGWNAHLEFETGVQVDAVLANGGPIVRQHIVPWILPVVENLVDNLWNVLCPVSAGFVVVRGLLLRDGEAGMVQEDGREEQKARSDVPKNGHQRYRPEDHRNLECKAHRGNPCLRRSATDSDDGKMGDGRRFAVWRCQTGSMGLVQKVGEDIPLRKRQEPLKEQWNLTLAGMYSFHCNSLTAIENLKSGICLPDIENGQHDGQCSLYMFLRQMPRAVSQPSNSS